MRSYEMFRDGERCREKVRSIKVSISWYEIPLKNNNYDSNNKTIDKFDIK